MPGFIKKQPPARIIAFAFALVIFVGSILLMLPFSVREGVGLKYIDSLFTSTSAVCVTGLLTVGLKETFTPFGQLVIAILMQLGGLGLTTVGAGIILAIGKKINLKGRTLIREALNVDSGKGIIKLIKGVIKVTLIFEITGAILSFIVFIKDYSFFDALGKSAFHSIASFNNSGLDILGNESLLHYKDNILLNLTTCVLIFFGGIGFLVIKELWHTHFKWKRLSMHAKTVLLVSFVLIFVGTLLIKLTENISWLGAFFTSVSARTAGFSTYALGSFSKAGLIVMIVLMFIGASPGSTGGGIKTSTVFVLFKGIKSSADNSAEKAFNYSIPKEAFRKASVIILLGIGIIISGTYLMCIFEPSLELKDILFEITSAFGTVGLSTGITPYLGIFGKFLTVIIMFIGRLGPLTVATMWHFSKGERASYPEGNITVG